MKSTHLSKNPAQSLSESSDTYSSVLDFLTVEDQAKIATTSKGTLTTLNKLYQRKLNQSATQATRNLQITIDEKNATTKPINASKLGFPLSAYVWQFAQHYAVTPQNLLEYLSNARDKEGTTPLISLCVTGDYYITQGLNTINCYTFNNSAFKLLNILISVCGYDVNQRQGFKTGLDHLVTRYLPNDPILFPKQSHDMIKFMLFHKSLNRSSATSAFKKAVTKAIPLNDDPKRKSLSLEDFLLNEKVDFIPTADEFTAVEIAIEYIGTKPALLYRYIQLMLKYSPDVDFTQALDAILKHHGGDATVAIKLMGLDVFTHKLNFTATTASGGKIEDNVSSRLLHVYLQANRILQQLQVEKSESKSSFSFAGKVQALQNLISAIKNHVNGFFEINLAKLEKENPALLSPELEEILLVLKKQPQNSRIQYRRL
ncbi:MAG: hypothetical protein ACYCQI_10500 [Gammaproteobacteria bacterium]